MADERSKDKYYEVIYISKIPNVQNILWIRSMNLTVN